MCWRGRGQTVWFYGDERGVAQFVVLMLNGGGACTGYGDNDEGGWLTQAMVTMMGGGIDTGYGDNDGGGETMVVMMRGGRRRLYC